MYEIYLTGAASFALQGAGRASRTIDARSTRSCNLKWQGPNDGERAGSVGAKSVKSISMEPRTPPSLSYLTCVDRKVATPSS